MTHNIQNQTIKTTAQTSSKASVEKTQDSLFGDVIYSYSRADAIADGVLVDVSDMAKEAGFNCSMAMTAAAWAACVEWTPETDKRKATYQDESGRLWDVLYMCSLYVKAAARRNSNESRIYFELHRVPVAGRGIRPRRVVLAVEIGAGDHGEMVMTVMMPNED